MNLFAPFAVSLSLPLFLTNVAVATMIVAVAGLLLERLARGAALPLRHLLLVSTLVAAVGSPVIIGAMLYSGRSLLQLSLAEDEQAPRLPETVDAMSSDGFAASQRSTINFEAPNPAVNPMAEPVDAGLKEPSAPGERSGPRGVGRAEPSWPSLLQSAGAIMTVAWCIGSFVSLGHLMRGLLQLRRLGKSLRPQVDLQLNALAQSAAQASGLRTVPRLYESPLTPSPISVGAWRSFVVLPIGSASSFTANQLRGLLLHEFAHIARRDHWIGVLQRLSAIMFWWNLPLREASSRISEIRELICDDVSTGGDEADDYAAMLLSLASRMAKPQPLPAALGVFDGRAGEFTRRVSRLLESRGPVVTTLNGRAKILAACCFLILLAPAAVPLDVRGAAVNDGAGLAEPAEQAAPQTQPALTPPDEHQDAADTQEDDATRNDSETKVPAAAPIKWPKRFRGVVKDVNGRPIAGAKVRFDFQKIHEYSIGRWDETLESISQVTGEDGEYSVDAAKFASLTHRPYLLMLTCTADGYADAKWWNWYSRSDNNLQEHLTDVEMVPGRVVRGRCVDPAGAPVADAIVKMAAKYDSTKATGSWSWDPRQTSADGTFEFSVPRDGDGAFEIWAVHPEWAPERVALPSGEDDLGDVHLQTGATVRGTVREADGTPVSGTVVVAESVDSGDLNSVAFATTVATKTDVDGNYEFQPLLGSYKIYLSEAEEIDNRLDQRFVVADGPPPLVVPARLELAAGKPQTHDIRSGATLKITGTVRWADGRPVPSCEAKASYLPSGNGTGIWIARTLTDENGSYTLELPNPIDDVSINVIGKHDANRVWHTAEPVESVNAKQKSAQFLGLYPLDGDVSGMDWVLAEDP